MEDHTTRECERCGNVGFDDGSSDGFFYCLTCGLRADDMILTDTNPEDADLYQPSHRRPTASVEPETLSQSHFDPPHLTASQSQFWESLNSPPSFPAIKREPQYDADAFLRPSEPSDFGSSSLPLTSNDYYSEMRIRYVMGVQLMIQMQCEALVEKFNVSPLICGLSGTIWLRFVATTRVFDRRWADDAIHESEVKREGDLQDTKSRIRHSSEPHNMFGERAVMIWYRSLRKTIPMYCSLAVCYLCCHVVREAVLPTDILKWTLEGKLPYFAAFVDIENQIGRPSSACPISSSVMFRPSQPVPLQKLESFAASIAKSVGLDLPPANFHAIASRYLMELSLSEENILPYACRIQEWAIPSELWLSTSALRIPTRVSVMAILIVAIRILYNLHGFGFWEKSLSRRSVSSLATGLQHKSESEWMDDDDTSPNKLGESGTKDSCQFRKSVSEAAILLHKLEARYDEIGDTVEYSEDLATYLRYCEDLIFAGLETPYEDYEEQRTIKQLQEFYINRKDSDPAVDLGVDFSSILNHERSRVTATSAYLETKEQTKVKNGGTPHLNEYISGSLNGSSSSSESQHHRQHLEPNAGPELCSQNSMPTKQVLDCREEAIMRLKANMEDNSFCYIPPRVNIKRLDYLHYVQKKDEGSTTYVAHADYYILLRACARVAQVDIRVMHAEVLTLERRLGWIENRINHCLLYKPPEVSCEFCSNLP